MQLNICIRYGTYTIFSHFLLQQQKMLLSVLYSYLNFMLHALQLNELSYFASIIYIFSPFSYILPTTGWCQQIPTNKLISPYLRHNCKRQMGYLKAINLNFKIKIYLHFGGLSCQHYSQRIDMFFN